MCCLSRPSNYQLAHTRYSLPEDSTAGVRSVFLSQYPALSSAYLKVTSLFSPFYSANPQMTIIKKCAVVRVTLAAVTHSSIAAA